MSNYIFADLKRIIKRIPFLISILLINLALAGVLLVSHGSNWNSVYFVICVQNFSKVLPIILGLIVLSAVFLDDFKAKTMQVAIGTGLPRGAVVFSKLIEVCVLTAFSIFTIGVVAFGMGGILHAETIARQNIEIIQVLLKAGSAIIGYCSITMILMFFTQTTGFATLFYIGLSAHIVEGILEIFTDIKYIQVLNLKRFFFSSLVETVFTRMLLGTIDVGGIIGMIIYIIGAAAIAFLLFKKRELEF